MVFQLRDFLAVAEGFFSNLLGLLNFPQKKLVEFAACFVIILRHEAE